MIYLLVCMFACSCCIVIGAFVPSHGGQICKSTPDGGARSQFRELSPFRRLKHDKLTGSLWCINYLCFSTITLSLLFYAWYNFAAKIHVIMATQPLPQLIFILLDIFVTNDLRKGVSFQKKMFFKMGMMKGCHPYHPWVGWSGEGLRWWLSWFRCEHEGLSLSPKDQFVITPYLYSYQVQPLETVWAVAWSELARFEP